MAKTKVLIEFTKRVSYQVEVQVTEEELKMLEAVDGFDLNENSQHIEAYYFINDFARDENYISNDEDLYDIEINEIH